MAQKDKKKDIEIILGGDIIRFGPVYITTNGIGGWEENCDDYNMNNRYLMIYFKNGGKYRINDISGKEFLQIYGDAKRQTAH